MRLAGERQPYTRGETRLASLALARCGGCVTVADMGSALPVLFVALDDVVVDVASGARHVAKEVVEAYAGREELVPGIHAKRDPVAGALEGCRRLREAGRHEVYFVAATPVGNPSAAAGVVDWVVRHLGVEAAEQLVLAGDWSRLAGDVLLARESRGFAGEWVRFEGWEAALERLLG